ncbi:probable ubiquitin carboxyl-terminal hydrolase MINDY-4 [Protopterus annectens]|uniref:probable ubiquitin carboxyl-terminal hydrolase MINDY-4 n=1 Tax=Protopterus annectens TaxID=7888 RepID=UPI001CF94685|nr:probable ubiquitin carboxyl-terminal hydrolase MINDY-4 [Protopterus annectens]
MPASLPLSSVPFKSQFIRMDNTVVGEVAASLVREFLSRKGLKNTIAIMDEEYPRSVNSINNRNELKRVLNLEHLCKLNKAQVNPLKTMLELITKYFMDFGENENNALNEGVPLSLALKQQTKALKPRSSAVGTLNILDISDDEKGGSTAVSDLRRDVISSDFEHEPYKTPAVKVHQMKKKESEMLKIIKNTLEDNVAQSSGFSENMGNIVKLDGTSPVETKNLVSETQRVKSSRLIRGLMTGPVASSHEDFSKKRFSRRQTMGTSTTPHLNENEQRKISFRGVAGFEQDIAASGELVTSAVTTQSALKMGQDFSAKMWTDLIASLSDSSLNINNVSESTKDLSANKLCEKEKARAQNSKDKTLLDLTAKDESNKNSRLQFLEQNLRSKHERNPRVVKSSDDRASCRQSFRIYNGATDPAAKDLQLDDVGPEEMTEKFIRNPVLSLPAKIHVDSSPLDLRLAVDVKNLLFGSSRGCFNEEWKIQNFKFGEVPHLKYGIVQKKGGPCGILAAVQACFLQKLLFEENGNSKGSQHLQPTPTQRTSCLVMCLADILWRAGDKKKAVVALSSGKQQFIPAGRYKADGILEMLMLNTVSCFDDLQVLLGRSIFQFETGPFGCILFLLSAVFSRSVELVRADFDVPDACLIGAHGYCTQELVNLLLTGRAMSNVFNDNVELDSGNGNITLLKGIPCRSNIGLLSLFEHYKACQVGSYMKTPKYPIWVICSESHFSVLFCLRKDLLNDWKIERKFDLYYYDGLANQQEEIRLTVDTTQTCITDKENDLTPPLEQCIRTKWKGAAIDWNGTEPIL